MASSSLSRPNSYRHLTSSLSRSIHQGPDTIDELLDRHVVKTNKNNEEDELQMHQRLVTNRREALSLYRDIIRASRFFTWPNNRGIMWRDVLRENTRKEFEEARFERDPEIVTRLLIGGRDAVQAALDKLVESHRKNMDQNAKK